MKTKELNKVKQFINDKIRSDGFHKRRYAIERMEDRLTDDKYMDTNEYSELTSDILLGRGMEEAGTMILKHIEKLEKEGVPEEPEKSLEQQLEEVTQKQNELQQRILGKIRGKEASEQSKKNRNKYKLFD